MIYLKKPGSDAEYRILCPGCHEKEITRIREEIRMERRENDE